MNMIDEIQMHFINAKCSGPLGLLHREFIHLKSNIMDKKKFFM